MPRGSGSVRRSPTQPLLGPLPALSSLQDVFAGSTLSARWFSYGTVSVSGGNLNTLATTGYSGAFSAQPWRLTGSYALVKITPPPVGNGSFQTALELDISQASNSHGAIGVRVEGSPLHLTPYWASGTGTVTNRTGITLPANPIWVRIRESGGTVYWDWSADTVTWTNFDSLADPMVTGAVYPQLYSGHYAAETDTNAVFDTFNVPPVYLTGGAPLYAKTILADTPSVYWRLDETSGTSFADSSGNGNAGTLVTAGGSFTPPVLNQPGLLPADTDTCVSFPNRGDGYGSGCFMGPASGFTPYQPGSQRTFEAWIMRGTTNAYCELFKSSLSNAGPQLQLNDDGSIEWAATTTGNAGWSAGTVPINVPVHVALTYNDATLTAELFVNGVSKGTQTLPGGDGYAAGAATAIFSAAGDPWNGAWAWIGSFDEVAVYNTTLTATQIAAHYAAASQLSAWATAQGAASCVVTLPAPPAYLTPSAGATAQATAQATAASKLTATASGTAQASATVQTIAPLTPAANAVAAATLAITAPTAFTATAQAATQASTRVTAAALVVAAAQASALAAGAVHASANLTLSAGAASQATIGGVAGGGPPSVTATFVAEHTTANTVYTAPAGIATGDWLIIYQFVYRGVGTPVFTNADATPPAGFVPLPGTWLQAYTGGATDKYGQFGWIKQAGGSEPSTYTVTHVALAAARGMMLRISGADPTTPLTPAPTQNLSGGGGHTTTFLGLTTTVPNELIVVIQSDDNDLNGALVAPTGTTPTFTIGVNDQHGNFMAYGTLASPGATGNKTMSNNSNADFSFFGSMLALQGAAVALPGLTAPSLLAPAAFATAQAQALVVAPAALSVTAQATAQATATVTAALAATPVPLTLAATATTAASGWTTAPRLLKTPKAAARSAATILLTPTAFPATPLLDDFNRANQGPPPSASWVGGFNSDTTGALAVVGNQCTATTAFWNSAAWNQVFAYPEVYVDVWSNGNEVLLWTCVQSVPGAAEGYMLDLQSNGTWVLWKGFTDFQIASGGPLSLVGGESFGIRVLNGRVTVWFKPISGSWTQLADVADSTYTTGYLGIESPGVGAVFDNFSGGPALSGLTAPTLLSPVASAASQATATIYAPGVANLTLSASATAQAAAKTTAPALLGGPPTATYDAVVLADSPQAFWPMNEPSGTAMVDASPHGVAGSYSGVTLGVVGIGDGETAASFNGSTSYGSSAAVGAAIAGLSVVTVEFWIKWTTFSSDDRLACEYDSPWYANDGFVVDMNSASSLGNVTYATNGSGNNITDTPQQGAGAWAHWVFVFDRTSAAPLPSYYNGAPATTSQDAANAVGGTFFSSTLWIMSRLGTGQFGQGSLAKLAIYSGALTPTQVANHYNARSGAGGGVSAQATAQATAIISSGGVQLSPTARAAATVQAAVTATTALAPVAGSASQATATVKTTASLTPSAGATSQATALLTAPVHLTLIPLVVTATDDFNRADGAIGAGWTVGSDSPIVIVSQQMKGSVGGTWTESLRAETSYSGDQWSEIQAQTPPIPSDWIGATVRTQNNGQDCYRFIYYNNAGVYELRLGKRTSGTGATLTTVSLGSSPLPAGTTLALSVQGTTLSLWINGAIASQTQDASFNGGVPGIIAFGTTATADNWRGGSITMAAAQALAGVTSGGAPIVVAAQAASQAQAAATASTDIGSLKSHVVAAATVALTAPSALTAAASAATQATATISPPLVAGATATTAASAVVTAGTAWLAMSLLAQAQAQATATLTAAAPISVTATATTAATATVVAQVLLSPFAGATSAASANVTAAGVAFLTASSNAKAAATATLTAQTAFTAQANASAAASMTVTWSLVTTPVPVVPVAAAASTATVALSAPTNLTATAGAAGSALAQMTAGRPLSAAAASTAAAAATVVVTVGVSPVAGAASAASCFLVSGAISLLPHASASAAAQMVMATGMWVTAQAASTSAATASTTAAAVLTAAASSQTQTLGATFAPTYLAPSPAAARTAAQATFTVAAQLQPVAQSATASSATVGYRPWLSPSATATAGVSMYVGYMPGIVGSATAQAQAVMVLIAPYVSGLVGPFYADVLANRTFAEVLDPTMSAEVLPNRSYADVDDPDVVAAVTL